MRLRFKKNVKYPFLVCSNDSLKFLFPYQVTVTFELHEGKDRAFVNTIRMVI